MIHQPFDKATASVTDRIAWTLCQILDDDAPLHWTYYRAAALYISGNKELMADLRELGKQP